ncbi:MAG: hypothetical protein AAF205_08045 [Pseudomonadota bacterium]
MASRDGAEIRTENHIDRNVGIETDRIDHIVVRMLRTWIAARLDETAEVPALIARADMFGASPDFAIACASLFQLAEGRLGRRLVPECCCSPDLSVDERAIVALVRHARREDPIGTTDIEPAGLSVALLWAAYAVNRSLYGENDDMVDMASVAAPSMTPEAKRDAAVRTGHHA